MGGRSGGVGPLLPPPPPPLHPSMLIFLPEAGSESAAEAATRAAFELKTNQSIPIQFQFHFHFHFQFQFQFQLSIVNFNLNFNPNFKS